MAEAPIRDQYVVLLERSLEETRLQREATQKVLQELAEERRQNKDLLQRLAAQGGQEIANERTPKGKTRRVEMDVPTPCKRKTRDVYKELVKMDDFNGFNFTQMFGSTTNAAVVKRVTRAVVEASGEAFSSLQVEHSLRIYFRSLRDREKRNLDGKAQAHRTKCRRQIRLREKAERLRKALTTSGWDMAAKEEALDVMFPEFMSSEESSTEQDDDNNERAVFLVKRLPWERKKMKIIKRKLRKLYEDSMTERQKRVQVTRKRLAVDSERSVPADAPAWAVRRDIGEGGDDINE